MADVNITLVHTNKGATTDKKGLFTLKVRSNNDTLQFSMLGYSTLKLSVLELKDKNYTVVLPEKVEGLSEVELKGKRKLRENLKYDKLTSLKQSIFDFGACVVNNKIYIVGGDETSNTDVAKKAVRKANEMISDLDDLLYQMRRHNEFSWKGYSKKIQVYDIGKGEWTDTLKLVHNRAYHNLNYHNNTLFALGGKRISTNGRFEYLNETIDVINLDSLSVKVDRTNPHQAINFTSVVYKDHLVVLGGSYKKSSQGKELYPDGVHVYNFNSGLWYELTKMPYPKEVNGVVVGDKIYLIGGYNGQELSTIETFDLVTGIWQTIGQLPIAIKRPALAVNGNDIYIYNNGTMMVYDTKKNILTNYHLNLQLQDAGMHCYNDTLYLIGGYEETDYSKRPSPNIYTIELSEFLKTKSTVSKID
ncbi:carboxypeptidase-like regulatory domain-containing protein [Seonamhaeicola sp. NFXS20]